MTESPSNAAALAALKKTDFSRGDIRPAIRGLRVKLFRLKMSDTDALAETGVI